MHKIQIDFDLEKEAVTTFDIAPNKPINTILIGLVLASATRVICAALQDAFKKNGINISIEQLEAQIAGVYNADLEKGDAGEAESLKQIE